MPVLHGRVKWDGCGDWSLGTKNFMHHTCEPAEVVSIGAMMQIAYEISRRELTRTGIWDDYNETYLPIKWTETEYNQQELT